MIEDFETTRKGHLRKISAAKHRPEFELSNQRPDHLTAYYARSKVRDSEKPLSQRILIKKAFEPSQTASAASIVIANKEDALFLFSCELQDGEYGRSTRFVSVHSIGHVR